MIKGILEYLDLSDWWISNFSEAEREYILKTFQPLGSDGNSLAESNIISTSQTPIGLLTSLAGWFRKKDDRTIAYRIIKKAEEMINDSSDILDLHFLFQTKMGIFYKNRDNDAFAFDEAIKACKQQIEIAPKAKAIFQKELKGIPIRHKGFEQLAIVEEKQKNFHNAIEICKMAMGQGWKGDWEKRIGRCQKKLKIQLI